MEWGHVLESSTAICSLDPRSMTCFAHQITQERRGCLALLIVKVILVVAQRAKGHAGHGR